MSSASLYSDRGSEPGDTTVTCGSKVRRSGSVAMRGRLPDFWPTTTNIYESGPSHHPSPRLAPADSATRW